jgi:hypothetical protein
VGDALEVTVTEGGRERALRVSAQDLPSLAAQRTRAGEHFEFITVTPAVQAERNLSSADGALLITLSADAQRVGLRENDVVLEINRRPVRNAQEAAQLMRRAIDAGQVEVLIERQGRQGYIRFGA